jgi:hypothetical protein
VDPGDLLETRDGDEAVKARLAGSTDGRVENSDQQQSRTAEKRHGLGIIWV